MTDPLDDLEPKKKELEKELEDAIDLDDLEQGDNEQNEEEYE